MCCKARKSARSQASLPNLLLTSRRTPGSGALLLVGAQLDHAKQYPSGKCVLSQHKEPGPFFPRGSYSLGVSKHHTQALVDRERETGLLRKSKEGSCRVHSEHVSQQLSGGERQKKKDECSGADAKHRLRGLRRARGSSSRELSRLALSAATVTTGGRHRVSARFFSELACEREGCEQREKIIPRMRSTRAGRQMMSERSVGSVMMRTYLYL